MGWPVSSSNPLLEAALAADRAGLNVLPPKEDGSKAPIAPDGTWAVYQTRKSTEAELAGWYGACTGIGIVCGITSGKLELFEFDDTDVYCQFKELAQATGLGDLVERLEAGYLEQTPGGIHWFFRCPEISGNTALARRPSKPEELAVNPTKKVQVLMETRGQGGYAIVAPSNGRVHPSGKPYLLLRGSFSTILTITPEEHRSLWQLARTFDQMPPGHDAEAVKPQVTTPGGRPGDDYNVRGSWEELLNQHGWTMVYQRRDTAYWRRPGKDRGISATTNFHGSDLLYVFSTSTAFESERGYSKFGAFALLKHGCDFPAAARVLAFQGYGKSTRGHRPRRIRSFTVEVSP
jgi:putative DNA primase/helicase